MLFTNLFKNMIIYRIFFRFWGFCGEATDIGAVNDFELKFQLYYLICFLQNEWVATGYTWKLYDLESPGLQVVASEF